MSVILRARITFPNTYYFKFYFSEVIRSASQNKSMSFIFLVNGDGNKSDPILSAYGSLVTEFYSQGYHMTAALVVSLVNTANASLSPIINAMEVFKVQAGLTNGSNKQDVNALMMLQDQYQQLQLWAGDPCLPAGFTWDWINCNADDPPRVSEL
ncbi:hypothetical protein EJ110_NYTH19451 [Nymphaea thermarum]|nr:hypothetical protein EJ110_NYTH19451 [Nymphaea thermarum]